jgi:tripartite-type tricarboxylate transporter receptor subunit TctC
MMESFMMHKVLGRVRLVGILGSLMVFAMLATSCSGGDDFPARDIEWYVGFSAGGGFDTASRFIAEEMSADLGGTVVVRNLEGGGGRRAAQEINKVDPDGYAISIMNMPNQILAEKLDPQGVDFNQLSWLGRAVIQTYGLYTAANSKFNTPADVVALGDDVRFCLSGLAGHSFLVASVTTEVMNIAWHPVTGYKGAETQAGLLRGDCELALGPMAGSTLTAVQGPDFKALWIYEDERFAPLPDVPTVTELGFPELGGGKFANNGLVAAPPGVPDDIMKQLIDSFDKALQDPDVVANINKKGMAVKRLTQAETDEVVKGMDSIVVEYLELVRAKSKSQ